MFFLPFQINLSLPDHNSNSLPKWIYPLQFSKSAQNKRLRFSELYLNSAIRDISCVTVNRGLRRPGWKEVVDTRAAHSDWVESIADLIKSEGDWNCAKILKSKILRVCRSRARSEGYRLPHLLRFHFWCLTPRNKSYFRCHIMHDTTGMHFYIHEYIWAVVKKQ